MKSALNIFLMILLGLSVSFCSMFSKDTEEKEEENTQQYEQYSSSGVYNDIEGESQTEDTGSSEDYSDDSYGSVDEGGEEGEGEGDGDDEGDDDDQLLVGGGDEDPLPQEDPLQSTENVVDDYTTAAVDAGNEPLPVVDVPKPAKKKKRTKKRRSRRNKASVSKSNFKNGMYRMGRKCNMRKKPSTKASKVGKVKKGKKLWVEGHNSKWVKVYKKSGAVYLHRSCL